MKQPLFVGLDVDGTTMKAAEVDDAGRALSPPVSLPTEAARGQAHGLERMCETIRQAVRGRSGSSTTSPSSAWPRPAP